MRCNQLTYDSDNNGMVQKEQAKGVIQRFKGM